MIDTIVIVLSKDHYQITDPDKFTPSAKWALSDRITNIRTVSKQNITKRELAHGIYKPKLTLSYRPAPRLRVTGNPMGGLSTMLKIELSLPKLFFGNNFNELRYKDFKPLIEKLASTLQSMGIETTPQALAHAQILAIHYSKNIKLTDGSMPYHYIQKLKASNMRLSLDVNQTDYRNDGHSYKWHSNYYEIVFYDKIMDLEKAKVSSKRAIEKENEIQAHLLNKLKKRWMLEILRMEVRLNRREKIRRVFKKLGIKADLTLQKLFKPALSKKVLLHYLEELESKRPPLIDYKAANSNKALLIDLIFNNPGLNQNQILKLFGLKHALDTMNPRELRMILASCKQRKGKRKDAQRNNSTSWARTMKDAAKIKLPISHSPLRILKEQLIKFEIIKI